MSSQRLKIIVSKHRHQLAFFNKKLYLCLSYKVKMIETIWSLIYINGCIEFNLLRCPSETSTEEDLVGAIFWILYNSCSQT